LAGANFGGISHIFAWESLSRLGIRDGIARSLPKAIPELADKETLMENLVQDVRYGIRTLAKNPGSRLWRC